MKIAVTGSSGRLGGALVGDLRRDHEVVSIDLEAGPYTGFVGSITDPILVARVLASCDAVIHTASLHAPHLASHSRSEFLRTNVDGTLNLLETAVRAGVRRFVYSSTTSLYGSAMENDHEAVWVTEDLRPQPRDIYDITKIAAEELCLDVARSSPMVVVSLRISRYFPEAEHLRAIFRLYRGVDLRDVVAAHRLALNSGIEVYDVFNVSARSPFTPDDRRELHDDARAVIRRRHPSAEAWFASRGWTLPTRIDRVYSIEKAERLLGYAPRHNFAELLAGDPQHFG